MHFYAYPYYDPWRLGMDPRSSAPFNDLHQTQAISDPPSPFPSVDTKVFNKSAEKFQTLIKQVELLIDKVISSPQFAIELMEAAQLSNTKKVDELILSTGITVKVKNHFTPTGIIIDLDNTETEASCCTLRMVLHW